MSIAFIVLTGHEKHNILYPRIIGPFPNQEAARTFALRDPQMENGLRMPIDGGYAGCVIVCADTAESPETVLAEWENYKWSMEVIVY